jgi:hypothetical protein
LWISSFEGPVEGCGGTVFDLGGGSCAYCDKELRGLGLRGAGITGFSPESLLGSPSSSSGSSYI